MKMKYLWTIFLGSIVSVSFILGTAVVSSAQDCYYDGEAYSPGTRIGSMVCQPDGTWQPEAQ